MCFLSLNLSVIGFNNTTPFFIPKNNSKSSFPDFDGQTITSQKIL